jgi:hypothetical protein
MVKTLASRERLPLTACWRGGWPSATFALFDARVGINDREGKTATREMAPN